MNGRLACIAAIVMCGCAHVASTRATFTRGGDVAGLTLKIARHMDTIVRGPDIDEDQMLVLDVTHWRLRERLKIPSDSVTPHFSVSRFGPSSTGQSYRGSVTITSVSTNQVVANVNLVVTARTSDGSYIQQAKFRGDYTFYRE